MKAKDAETTEIIRHTAVEKGVVSSTNGFRKVSKVVPFNSSKGLDTNNAQIK
jgi:RNA:NAD 2'-phosphotransferase (TPT1/KptA family)